MEQQHLLNIVRQHYPNAIATGNSVDILFDIVKRELNLEPHQLMHADSICSDDINSIEYPERARTMLGPFNMGGLNGFPFTGLTGMGAFAGHVPVDGAVFIFYAPHIGITKHGALGEVHRVGQNTTTGCCGAARAALAKLMADEIVENHVTELDHQQNTIEQIFLRSKDRIKKAEIPLKEATEVMYEAIDERICLLLSHTKYPCRYAILGGSILINGDHDMGSFAVLKRFDIVDLETKEVRSFAHEFN